MPDFGNQRSNTETLKIGIARLWHEANSFTPTSTGFGHFQAREYAKGGAEAQVFHDTSVETGAFRWGHGRERNLSSRGLLPPPLTGRWSSRC